MKAIILLSTLRFLLAAAVPGGSELPADIAGNTYSTVLTPVGLPTTRSALQPAAPTSNPPIASLGHGFVIALSASRAIVYSTYFSGGSFDCPASGCFIIQPPF